MRVVDGGCRNLGKQGAITTGNSILIFWTMAEEPPLSFIHDDAWWIDRYVVGRFLPSYYQIIITVVPATACFLTHTVSQ